MQIQKAQPEDLAGILPVYAAAREFMRSTGNPRQWGDSFPPEDLLREEIQSGGLYTVSEDGEILAAFYFAPGPDPCYRVIENGRWLNAEPYYVIHRVASSGKKKGLLPVILQYCEAQAENIRIDTHDDNRVMQHLLEKNGYTRCGRVYMEDGSPRIAYQKCVKNPAGT